MICKQCNLPYPSGSSNAENSADFCSQRCMDKWYQTLVEVNNALTQEQQLQNRAGSSFDVSGYNWEE